MSGDATTRDFSLGTASLQDVYAVCYCADEGSCDADGEFTHLAGLLTVRPAPAPHSISTALEQEPCEYGAVEYPLLQTLFGVLPLYKQLSAPSLLPPPTQRG